MAKDKEKKVKTKVKAKTKTKAKTSDKSANTKKVHINPIKFIIDEILILVKSIGMGIFSFFSKEKKETLDKGLSKTKENVFSKITRAIVLRI